MERPFEGDGPGKRIEPGQLENKRRILPLAWLAIAIVLMVALHRFWPLGEYLGWPWTLSGAVPLLFGLYMAASSAAAFRRAETGLIPFSEATRIMTTGFFRYTRNPMYLGMVLALLGLALFFGCLAVLLPVAAFAVVIHYLYILREERFMEEAFGDEYLAYRQRVRRWL